ncbi:hypothetical protein GGE07_005928 [Sinorhizobium terangae]|nr:hypothetical protein [Sinorhizobium terangae]
MAFDIAIYLNRISIGLARYPQPIDLSPHQRFPTGNGSILTLVKAALRVLLVAGSSNAAGRICRSLGVRVQRIVGMDA